jgi:hypothetical protein
MVSKEQYEKHHHAIRESQEDEGPDTMCPEKVGHPHHGECTEERSCKGHETNNQADVRTGKYKVFGPFGPSSCPYSQETESGDIKNS